MADSFTELARRTDDIDRRLIELFATLETMDPEVVTRIFDMLGERLNAAQWIVRPVPGLGGMTSV